MNKEHARPLPPASPLNLGDCYKRLSAAAVLWRKAQALFEHKAEQADNLITRSMARLCGQTAKSFEQAAADLKGQCACCFRPKGKQRNKQLHWKV